MSSRTPPIALELRPSALYGLLLALLALSAAGAALASHHPLWLKSLLLAGVAGLLYHAWRDEREQGACHLFLSQDGRVAVRYRHGATVEGQFAGHAWLGSLAVFVFVGPARTGSPDGSRSWRERLSSFRPARITVLRDATDADAFRRLRARLRLSVPG